MKNDDNQHNQQSRPKIQNFIGQKNGHVPPVGGGPTTGTGGGIRTNSPGINNWNQQI